MFNFDAEPEATTHDDASRCVPRRRDRRLLLRANNAIYRLDNLAALTAAQALNSAKADNRFPTCGSVSRSVSSGQVGSTGVQQLSQGRQSHPNEVVPATNRNPSAESSAQFGPKADRAVGGNSLGPGVLTTKTLSPIICPLVILDKGIDCL